MALLALGIVLLAAACSGDAGAEGTAAASPPTTAAPADPGSTPAGSDEGGDVYLARLARCLQEAGWPATVVADQLEVPGVQGEQNERLAEASATCQQELGPPPATQLSAAEIQTFYDAFQDTAACLEAEGYLIEPAPSFDVFLESWATGPWHPYLSIPADTSPEEFQRLEQKCPQP